MPGIFSRLKGRDHAAKLKEKNLLSKSRIVPPKPQWEDAWARKSVEPEEVYEFLHRCMLELKLRGLDIPFLLLPYRPTSNPNAARSFVRSYFQHRPEGENLAQELRLVEPMALCSIIKWCWSRIAGGVVGWDAYQLFKVGESDSNMARSSFATFIPLSVDSDARSKIIFDFFDLLSAIAANSKSNGLGGRKLSRLAGWWAFEQKDDGNGFEGGYKKWTAAADATSHLFFAYLRSLSPELGKGLSCISRLPVSLQKLVQETEYPPDPHKNMRTQTYMVLMVVDCISPTPLALLRRANHFNYRDDDKVLKELSNYSDPAEALTIECRRVLGLIASGNQTHVLSPTDSAAPAQVSWSRFEDLGFSGITNEKPDFQYLNASKQNPFGLREFSQTKMMLSRPTTPSWGQFLSSGFVDLESNSPRPLNLPNNLSLPPIEVRSQSSQSFRPLGDVSHLQPGELASISKFYLDDAFWLVWICSLATEEYAERKAVFGRCALIETVIPHGKWILMEEKVKGSQSTPQAGAYIAEKKHFWFRSKKVKTPNRRKSVDAHVNENLNPDLTQLPEFTRMASGLDSHARIQAAASRLQKMHQDELIDDYNGKMKTDNPKSSKISNSSNLQPTIIREASPAMIWAKNYDKTASLEKHTASFKLSSAHDSLDEKKGSINRDSPGTTVDDKSSAFPILINASNTKELTPCLNTDENLDKEKLIQDSIPTPVDIINITEGEYNGVEPLTTESPTYMRPRKNSASDGIKKLFGMSKSQNLRNTGHPPQSKAGREAMERMVKGSSLVRRLSGHKAKPALLISKTNPSSSHSSKRPSSVYGSKNDPSVSPHPSVSTVALGVNNLSRPSLGDENDAQKEFSRFDQGTPEVIKTPAPVDSDSDEYDKPSPKLSQQTHQNSPTVDVGSALNEKKSLEWPTGERETEKTQNEKVSEKDQDEVENEEETIEVRVARIKARVAQLTGKPGIGSSGNSSIALSS